MEENYNVCFIIALKYYRNYQTHIKYYVDNIQKYYKNAFTIIVDNNSTYIQDIDETFKGYENLVIITNIGECKFEIGAYKAGINYLITNDLIDTYDYCVFTQDNFVLKNKYDFDNLRKNNTLACTINSWTKSHSDQLFISPISQKILSSLNLQNSIHLLSLCWCNSFILHKSKILEFLDIVKDIVVTKRMESDYSERYLSGILYHLNNRIIADIDGDIEILNIHYDCWKVDVINDIIPNCFFVKRVQQKNEKTVDLKIVPKKLTRDALRISMTWK